MVKLFSGIAHNSASEDTALHTSPKSLVTVPQRVLHPVMLPSTSKITSMVIAKTSARPRVVRNFLVQDTGMFFRTGIPAKAMQGYGFHFRPDPLGMMALAFEDWTADERERMRVAVTRRREAWKWDTELERHFSDTAKLVCETREEQEEAVLAAAAVPAGNAGRAEGCATHEELGPGRTSFLRD